MNTIRSVILAYALDNYGTEPDNPWEKTPHCAVLRHRSSRKWYGLIMRVRRKTIGQDSGEETDIINLKCSELTREYLFTQSLAQPAYHMNKEKWITVLLDGSVPAEIVCGLLDESYEATK